MKRQAKIILRERFISGSENDRQQKLCEKIIKLIKKTKSLE